MLVPRCRTARLRPLERMRVPFAAPCGSRMTQGSRLLQASHILLLGSMFSWMISAYWMIVGTGVHTTFHQAQILHDKQGHSMVFAAYIRI